MRRELKKRGIKKLKVVFSTELPVKPKEKVEKASEKAEVFVSGDQPSGAFHKSTPGSVAFVPAVAGMIIGGEVIKDLIKD
jgi:tRNA A37 threonylcarbamoyladenosine dehydratase